MDDRLYAALAAIDPAAAAHCAARWPRMDAAERGAVEGLRADLRRAAEGLSRRAAAVALGVGDGSWARWIGRGGWLS